MQQLPIGLNDFEKIRKGNYLYVDKTKHLFEIATKGNYYFLSRPRRFGKTLMIDTLKCLFEGRKDLFEGLYVYDKWNWEETYPVIRIDFASGDIKSLDRLIEKILYSLKKYEDKFEIKCETKDISLRFDELITKTYKKYNQRVVLLIDEYDKPILDNLTKKELAEEIRETLANFYGTIKGLDKCLQFVILTGVSKFSKVNLFSKLNNLTDLTLYHKTPTICGYTEKELDIYFYEHLKGIDREKIKKWYNGYAWLGDSVYNPYDILFFIDNNYQFRPYWFETGTPTFLIKLMKEKQYFVPDLENIEATDLVLGSFDVDNIDIEPLLWQTGYLTIKNTKMRGDRTIYILSYPNEEVRYSLNDSLLKSITNNYVKVQNKVYDYLLEGDIENLINQFKVLFSSIPYSNFANNYISSYEGFYASVLYSFLASLGVNLIAEDITNKGRIDLTILIDNKVYIIEFKVGKENPLKQIKEKKYYEKYQEKNKEIYLIGINFSKEEKNIVSWEEENVKC